MIFCDLTFLANCSIRHFNLTSVRKFGNFYGGCLRLSRLGQVIRKGRGTQEIITESEVFF